MTKTAVVLFNLGGPDKLEAVQPFLFNLFSDPAIIRLPQPLRWLVAKIVSRKRAPIAREIYRKLGGRSPLLEVTQAQARLLEQHLNDIGDRAVFVAMRYWHPFVGEAARDVAAYAPDRIVLLPLYPQFSTTTTGSSLTAWFDAAEKLGLLKPAVAVCCYPVQQSFVRAQVLAVSRVLRSLEATGGDMSDVVVLFSAHGLPKKIIAAGDPYDRQVEQTVAAVVGKLRSASDAWSTLDCRICYQSRVGPLEWIGPGTAETIVEVAQAGKRIVVVPIAFVSEHSETLVELDMEYRKLAEENGAVAYERVPALGTDKDFIDALAEMVRSALGREVEPGVQAGVQASVQTSVQAGVQTSVQASVRAAAGHRTCPADRAQCPMTGG
jgi:ferrochelatase